MLNAFASLKCSEKCKHNVQIRNYRTGCRNVSHCQEQQSHSGLRSPGRSNSAYFWNDSWVQTFHRIKCIVFLQLLRSCPHVSVFVWKRIFFFLRFGLPSTRIRWKQSTTTHLLKKTPSIRSFHFPIIHLEYPPPPPPKKVLHKPCFQFLLEYFTILPKELENNTYANRGEAGGGGGGGGGR